MLMEGETACFITDIFNKKKEKIRFLYTLFSLQFYRKLLLHLPGGNNTEDMFLDSLVTAH